MKSHIDESLYKMIQNLLLDYTKFIVRGRHTLGPKNKTNLASPQGDDVLSPVLFIFYVDVALKKNWEEYG